jgi:hypothetical protein
MEPRPFARSTLVETGYEELSFVVLEARPDGWLRLRYASGESASATAWTPMCARSQSDFALDFHEWSAWFVRDALSPLYFRSDGRGVLRSAPSDDAPRLPAIGDDYILGPLEISGEWMRVTVSEPSDYCRLESESVRREGWVRWYAPDRGPLLWYFTRGC